MHHTKYKYRSLSAFGYLRRIVCYFLKGCALVYYKPEEPLIKHTVALDPNHTHFILVDDGTELQYGGEIDLRSKLEEHISKLKTVGGERALLLLFH